MYIGFHVKYPLLLSDFSEILIFLNDFNICSSSNFHENSSRGSRVYPCGQTDQNSDRQIWRS